MKVIKYILSGIATGLANVVPGLSGGTILVLTGSFTPLTESLSSVVKKHDNNRKEHILTIIEHLIGIIIGVLIFSFLIPILSKFMFAQLVVFFLGIVVASSYIFFKKEIQNIKKINWISFLIGFAICVCMALFVEKGESIDPTFVKKPSIWFLIALLALGALTGAAMIFPGISGSLILFMFGMYYTVWGYIKDTISQLIKFDFNWNMIIPCMFIGIGIILGVILSSFISKFVLKKYKYGSLSLILGLVLGGCVSLLPIDINIPVDVVVKWDFVSILTTIIAFIVGVIAIYIIQIIIKRILDKQYAKMETQKSIED